MSTSAEKLAEDDDKFFEVVAKELSIGKKDETLWTKAFALENGDDNKTKAHYIRLRVEKLRIAFKRVDENASKEQQQVIIPAPPSQQNVEVSPPTAGGNAVKDNRAVEKAALYGAAIGKNSGYYSSKFDEIESTGSSMSWNWSAFFLSTSWALYRKMWGVAALGLVATAISSGIFRDHAPGIEGALCLLIMVTFGAFGNYWYCKKVNRLITAERKLTSSYQTAIPKISSKGGTTLIPLFVIMASFIALLMYIWIDTLRASSPTAQPRDLFAPTADSAKGAASAQHSSAVNSEIDNFLKGGNPGVIDNFLRGGNPEQAPQQYQGLTLGMSMDDVVRAKGQPSHVLEDYTDPAYKRFKKAIARNDLQWSISNYADWLYWSPATSTRIDVSFSRHRLREIGCYAKLVGACGLFGITTGMSTAQIIDRLGKPDQYEMEEGAPTWHYASRNVRIYFSEDHAYMITLENPFNRFDK